MKILKWILLGPMLFVAYGACMGTFVAYETIRNGASWSQTVATIGKVEKRCQVYHRPGVNKVVLAEVACDRVDQVAIPPEVDKVRTKEGLHGDMVYVADGETISFTGMFQDAGIYGDVVAGQQVPIYYDPADPKRTDGAETKGAVRLYTGLLIAWLLIGLYVWFFWLRGRRPAPPAPTFGRRL